MPLSLTRWPVMSPAEQVGGRRECQHDHARSRLAGVHLGERHPAQGHFRADGNVANRWPCPLAKRMPCRPTAAGVLEMGAAFQPGRHAYQGFVKFPGQADIREVHPRGSRSHQPRPLDPLAVRIPRSKAVLDQ